jgi:Fur family transcriptional regulator, ferric uptake regulator
MKNTDALENVLRSRNIRVTQNRIDILKVFQESGEALSQSSVEDKLQKLDRITLYRTLKTFEQAGIIHQALDGTGTAKFALCYETCDKKEHRHEHAHFHCSQCNKTLCIDVKIPEFAFPAQYKIESSHLIVRGLCKNCMQ